jgi:hypothetical protein
MPYSVIYAFFFHTNSSGSDKICFICVCKMLGNLVFDDGIIQFANLTSDVLFNEIGMFVASLSLCLIFSFRFQSWHERFLGTFEGFGGG